MSRSAIGDLLWAEMTTAQQAEAVLAGRATLRQIVAGLLDGPDQLRDACRRFLARTDSSFQQLIIEGESNGHQTEARNLYPDEKPDQETKQATEDSGQNGAMADKKRRLGLPPGYKPRRRPQRI